MKEVITKESGVLTAKFQAAEFVRTALDLEVRVHTLKELANRCRSRGNDVVAKARSLCYTERAKFDKASDNLKRKNAQRNIPVPVAQAEEDNKTKSSESGIIKAIAFCFKIIFFAFVCSIVVSVIWPILGLVYFLNTGANPEEFDFLMIIAAAIAAILILLVTLIIKAKNKKDAIKRKKEKQKKAELLWEEQQRTLNREYELALQEKKSTDARLNDALAQFSRAKFVSEQLNEQAAECEAKAKEINETLQKGYVNTNIVPPDYRYIDCVIVLDHVFRNDLADTMRQAIFYYEEKKFRDMVLRGVNSIFIMLKDMANTMQDVKNMLNRIERSVSDISYNVMKVAENMYSLNQTQQENLKVNKARQYADECFYESQRYHNAYVESKLG